MSDVRFWVARYLSEGWSPIPIPKGEKGPRVAGWDQASYVVGDFEEDSNVGVHLGKTGLYDVDLDCQEALKVADLLLPVTARVSGRTSKPRSHRFYLVDEAIKHVAYHGLGGAGDTIIELRGFSGSGTPTQTVVPPSVHPSGEPVTWDVDGKPAHFPTAALLQASVRNVALAVILARAFPGPGHRHEPRLALAGFLYRAGLDELETLQVGKAVMALIGGDEGDWLTTAKSTLAKLKAGDTSITGGPTLKEKLIDGTAVLAKLNTYLGRTDQAALEDAVEQMNRRHFWVRLGKDDCIGREDTADGSVVFQRPRSLYTEYADQPIITVSPSGAAKRESVFEVWLRSPNRRKYREVVFRPPPLVADPQDYNLWRGYAVEPDPAAGCSLFLEHVHDVICGGNHEHYTFNMNLLALTVQEPGTPSGIATVLRGGQGTGKGIYARAIGDLVGRRHFAHVDRVDQIAGRFNGHLSAKIWVFADEAFWAGDRRELGAVKRLITEPTLHIERKGIDSVMEENHIHLVMATNEDWSWPAAFDERRGFLLKVSEAHKQDAKYFRALTDELKQGGLQALLALLLEWNIDRELLRNVPKTEELRDQQMLSLSGELKFVQECLWDGMIGVLPWEPGDLRISELYVVYATWATKHNLKRPLDAVYFGRKLNQFFTSKKTFTRKVNKRVERFLELRPLTDARRFFDAHMGTHGDWGDSESDLKL